MTSKGDIRNAIITPLVIAPTNVLCQLFLSKICEKIVRNKNEISKKMIDIFKHLRILNLILLNKFAPW